jgi:hypothetical protein
MSFPAWIKKMGLWFSGTNPQGLGTLLVGIAAMIALSQASSLLDRVLQIQDQAKKIDEAVSELRLKSIQMTNALNMMSNQLKELRAREATSALPTTNLTFDEVKKIIGTIPKKPSRQNSMIYLPSEKIDQTAENILKAKTQGQRTEILKNALKYESGILLQENGSPIIFDQSIIGE